MLLEQLSAKWDLFLYTSELHPQSHILLQVIRLLSYQLSFVVQFPCCIIFKVPVELANSYQVILS